MIFKIRVWRLKKFDYEWRNPRGGIEEKMTQYLNYVLV